MLDVRQHLLESWLKVILPGFFALKKLAGDASFRRYFRVHHKDQTYIVMDAPPEKENCQSFIAIAKTFAEKNIHVPEILELDLEKGFLLLTDLGDKLFFSELNSNTVDPLYKQALSIIPEIQTCKTTMQGEFPAFNERLILEELQLFPHWFLSKHLDIPLRKELQSLLEKTFSLLVSELLQQPQVCVHRDYHSRNLLCLANSKIGVLDFQDAVMGPITYDAVSLLRDCYIDWPTNDVYRWVNHFHDLLSLKSISRDQFITWFDLVGIQRHLKVLGIFARLYYRDGKQDYLKEMPRIMNYILAASENHPSLKPLRQFLQIEICETFGIALR